MTTARRVVGWALVGISAIAVIQTMRGLALWEVGQRRFDETHIAARSWHFAGHRFDITDDQRVDTGYSQSAVDGQIQPTMDGTRLGTPSRAQVRRAAPGLGRYHGWYDAWIFRSSDGRDSTQYLARRIQPLDADNPQFEITIVDPMGAQRVKRAAAWQLGWDYRVYRSTQFLRNSEWEVMPLALDPLIFFPALLLFFPVGTTIVGILLLRHPRA